MKTFFIWLVALSLVGIDILEQFTLAGKGLGVANRGISFGFGQNLNIWPLLILVVIFFLIKMNKRNIGIPFMLLGGLGNFVVRTKLGYVWDYIPLLGLSVNGCDLIINFGLITMIIQEWKK